MDTGRSNRAQCGKPCKVLLFSPQTSLAAVLNVSWCFRRQITLSPQMAVPANVASHKDARWLVQNGKSPRGIKESDIEGRAGGRVDGWGEREKAQFQNTQKQIGPDRGEYALYSIWFGAMEKTNHII